MENNKILIGVQFNAQNKTDNKPNRIPVATIELYVLRDITLKQLFDGIKYGLKKKIETDSEYKDLFSECFRIYNKCIKEKNSDYYSHVIITSYNSDVAGKNVFYDKEKNRCSLYNNSEISIDKLGFITSTKIIFDESGEFVPKGALQSEKISEAFKPDKKTNIIRFPEYNISSRQLEKLDNTPVNIIPPTDPPKEAKINVFSLLLPSLISMAVMILVRIVLVRSESAGSGIAMVALSVAMGMTAIITTVINVKKQKKDYKENLENWRKHYQNYIGSVLNNIEKRKNDEVAKLNELYPDMLTLINLDGKGIPLDANLYSRSPEDEDFLAVRLGTSDDVDSSFEINGESKEVVFSEAFFNIKDNILNIKLRNELEPNGDYNNLCELPISISREYRKLKNAPLLYSLKDKGAVGIVDGNLGKDEYEYKYNTADNVILRMIFELCYYHSPEDLQFIMFFKGHKTDDENDNLRAIDKDINNYKFLPHFRGLLSDMSQFVFDNESANYVLSNLLNIVSNRRDNEEDNKMNIKPHIVLIVFDEHGLKEHAFADYLPKPPQNGTKYVNDIGLTLVYVVKYKEYLPAYCNDIINITDKNMTLTPHENIHNKKSFRVPQHKEYGEIKYEDLKDFFEYDIIGKEDSEKFIIKITLYTLLAFQFYSSVYYAQIAQNGKVPSSVSSYAQNGIEDSKLEEKIRENWGMEEGKERDTEIDVTKSLKVSVGKKTENELVYLDLHERGDGPHMLVAGTTGSGKTEAIINYLLGLCMKFRPDELNLLLVDMKGGGFTKRIGKLPHVVGTVTDVDGDENGTSAEYMLRRFLDAMKAEIKLRKIKFNDLHVDSIDDYISACKEIKKNSETYFNNKGIVDSDEQKAIKDTVEKYPFSHLILVVDEFTELKRFTSENNDIDFIGEITTIARVGRSLGFHIILISQNIEGAITEDIRINSRARLCLKVATKQASKEMIGTEQAASPLMPGNGRAYLLVGTGSRLDYFQSGYSGVSVDEEIPVEFTLASKKSKYSSFYNSATDNEEINKKRKENKENGKDKKQLESIVETIEKVYKSSEMYKEKDEEKIPRMVFRPPLHTNIALGLNNKVVTVGRK